MSIRNIRKLYGGNELPPLEGNSDEEFEPLYAKASSSKFKYDALVLNSHSESEHDSDAIQSEESEEDNVMKKKKKKKKKQRRNSKPMEHTNAFENLEELDEIDKSLMEVNAMLGEPSPAPRVADVEAPVDPHVLLLAVQAKHLNSNNEMLRLFGPEEPGAKRRGRQPNLKRLQKRGVIVPVTDSTKFQRSGMSMSIQRRENGCTYFVFDHSREYQRIHNSFLNLIHQNYSSDHLAISIEDAQRNMHVEAILESADSLFRFEAYSVANTLIEQTICYMQYIAHPSFNLTDPKVRLEYMIPENRPFHIAVMKYMYLLTNRACHRTALELAKLLLNLDPSDPLAVLFVVDTLALRAREHQWLIDAVEYWSLERDAGFLFNMKYSNAMAHFHVAAKKKGEGMAKADELIQQAMLTFPGVVFKLLQSASVTPSARLRDCALFAKADDNTAKNLSELMTLYAQLTWSKWREPGVYDWFSRNVELLADKYDNDPAIQERAKVLANERLNLFQGWPEQIVRHLSIIKPMSNFLVDGAVPHVATARSADPVPPAGSRSRYYDRDRAPAAGAAGAAGADANDGFSLVEFVAALPNLRLYLPNDIERRVADYVGGDEERLVLAFLGVENNVVDAIVPEEFDFGSGDDDDDQEELFADEVVLGVTPDALANAWQAVEHGENGPSGDAAAGLSAAVAIEPSGAAASGPLDIAAAGPCNAAAAGPLDGAAAAAPSGAAPAGPSDAAAVGPSAAAAAGPSDAAAAGPSGATAADPPGNAAGAGPKTPRPVAD